jgi:putative ABC transport system permease protein
MRHLLRLVSVRYLRAAPGRTLLTLLGIMLGVSVVFAIDVVNTTVMGSFKSTIDNVAGRTALTIGASTGVAEELLEKVRAVPGVAAAVPVIEESAHDEKTGLQLAVLGIDTLSDSNVRDYEVTADDVKIEDDIAFLSDPHAVIVTRSFAQRHAIKVGDTLTLATVQGKADYTVRGLLAARGPAKVFGGDLLLMDVYAAQLAFGRDKRFDHIDVVPTADLDVATLQSRLEQVLEGKANVTRPERRTQETERLMAGFKLGLSLAGMVAIFVGGFIVYNALAIAVAQRRREIGILRALGTTRTQILLLFVGEGLFLGGAGAVLGLAFGMAMARSVLKLVIHTISALYVSVDTQNLTVAPRDIVVSVALGVGVSFLAALYPARRASWVAPASAMRKQTDSGGVALASLRGSLKTGIVTLLLAVVIAVLAHLQQNYLLGYGVAGICAFAAAFLSPALALGIGHVARRWLRKSNPALMLGSVSFIRNAGRNSVAIAALGMSLANVVNADVLVGSMKHNTARWFDRAARADVFVFAGQRASAAAERPLPESVGNDLSVLKDVAFVDPYRMTRHMLHGQPFTLVSYDLQHYLKYNEIPVVSGDLDRALPAIYAGTGLAASETFASKFQVKLGDRVELQTPNGPKSFEVVLTYVDYGSDQGILLTTRPVYKRVWSDNLVDSFGVYLNRGADVAQARARIADDLGKRYRLLALSNGEYKAEFMRFIDGSFALTRATELVAIIVAILGIINTLLVTVMDRRTEIGVLKAIGADAKQVQQMLITEGILIGLSATLLGIVFGTAFSAYVVKELLRFQIGWQMSWKLSGWVVLETFVVAQIVTFVSVWWPMKTAGRVGAVEALQYD